MTSYSQMLNRRARSFGLGLLVALAAAAWWQQGRTPEAGSTIFRPELRIDQVMAVGQVLNEAPALRDLGPSALPCDGRALRVLQARLITSLGLDEAAVTRYLQQAAAARQWGDCEGFTRAWTTALRLHRLDGQAPLTPARVAQFMTEDVSWSRSVPCLFAGSAQSPVLLAGMAQACGLQGRFQTLAAWPQQSSFRAQAAPLAQAATTAAMSGRWNPQAAQWLSLQPPLQARLDRWQGCLNGARCEGLAELAGLKNLSLVVLDATTGQILATWCEGPACDKARLQGAGGLAAALLEAPPASTAKLLFSLALAQDPGQHEMLQRQIKTSGQLDAGVTKRNEWWEKQAICDGRPACDVPEQVAQLGTATGLNAHCQARGSACGRWGLLEAESPGLIPGQVGRLVLSASSKAPAPMMDWASYDAIRQGRRAPPPNESYRRTASTVQAVIGGGDSRTSALGAATLSMQLWRLAQGQQPVLPTLLQAPGAAPAALRAAAPSLREPAQVVLQGMRKVVQPAERGWQGPGTAASHVQRVMGRACEADCGLWAKTGTVGHQDTVFGGTTLLSALVDTAAWSRWMDVPVLKGYENRVLAVGVVAMPVASRPGVHAASLLGMQAVRLLLSEQGSP